MMTRSEIEDLEPGDVVRFAHRGATSTWEIEALHEPVAGERLAVLRSRETGRLQTVPVERLRRMAEPDPEARRAQVRVPVTLTAEAYRGLAAIARSRAASTPSDDEANPVAEVIAWLVQRSLDEAERLAEEGRVREANRRHVAAVIPPWPSGPWTQDEVDEVVAAVRSGQTLEHIADSLRRPRRDVARLLREFGLHAPRSIDGSSTMRVAQ